MKVLIIGAGAQGGPCASILSRDHDVERIILGDVDIDLANKVKEKIGSSKIIVEQLDAGDVDAIKRVAKGVDAIITLTLTTFNNNIMEAALAVGAHYVDTSFGEPSGMDICASDNILCQIVKGRPIALDAEFKKAGLTAVHGCGVSPGTTNIMARLYADKLETVEAIRIRLGFKPAFPSDEIVSEWLPTWSPFRALWGYAIKPMVFENGEYKTYPIFSGYEEYRFREPIGMIPLVYHQHQEQITLPYVIGKGIKYCDFKYTIDKEAGTFIKQGFASDETIDVKGVRVSPLDVLMTMVRKPVDNFLSETAKSASEPLQGLVGASVELTGTSGGDWVEYKIDWPISMYKTPEERMKLFNKFGSSNIMVALPAVVAAKTCVKGDAGRGVVLAESLDPVAFLKTMGEMGVKLEINETCTRIVVSG